jgi:branched-subunit amino acid transport protein
MTPEAMVALVAASAGCYALKLLGMSLPRRVLRQATVQRVATLMPVAMLSALITVQMFNHGGHYGTDWHLVAGVAAAVIALLLRRGFLTVFAVAVAVTALLRVIA